MMTSKRVVGDASTRDSLLCPDRRRSDREVSMDTVDSPAARREDSLAEVPETVVKPFEDDEVGQTGRFYLASPTHRTENS